MHPRRGCSISPSRRAGCKRSNSLEDAPVQVELINVFIKAATDVLQSEVGEAATAGSVRVLSSAQTSEEVTVMIGVSGDVRGMVLLGMSERTAKAIVSRM